ncbi:Maltose transport system permease protein malF [Mannheimia haemolytica]|uniref:Maltose/maltodextrin transport system permease protein n=1 Tax=Mannheimia haemolytica TaxID=75985 RepID=A0A378N8H3_MANHA|nr:Maltose transport system permease protein malF [Mannheimia haemolytica]
MLTQTQSKSTHWLKYLLAGLVLLLDFYLVVLMYSQGEYLFAILTLIILTSVSIFFTNKNTYAWRYVYPGITGMAIFILFPLVATIAIAFTNYSGSNQLSFERAVSVLTEQRYFAGDKYQFTLYPQADNKYQIALTNPTTEQTFVSEPISLATGTNVVVTSKTDQLAKSLPLK